VPHLTIALRPAVSETVTCEETEARVRPVRSYAQTDLDMAPDQQERDQDIMIIGNSG
jgi:hypothetical protein